ncbi:TlpA family protein disulfide reductase [Oceanirhabdus sp. W0125-5]|uniref:TlpA family protein disulfide reductase n=1 Tax=Oceanirhabdus sp. W0125-5 TaxID=2999116 RepID=UPI0022F348E3|nr:hypothetical protein [Oceanirhabdus sp. W0125-5]WBW98165.1 hypothetical protein OW730_05205 [Oceanirhabdus sp. W0125-5]
MEILESSYKELNEKGINLIGIVTNASEKGNNGNLNKILSGNKVTFTNIIPSKELKEEFTDYIHLFPTTVFVDNNGNIVDVKIGASTEKEYFLEKVYKVFNNMSL